MYNAKVLLSVAALTGASMAQTSTTFPDPGCSSSVSALVIKAPTAAPEVMTALDNIGVFLVPSVAGSSLLASPAAYLTKICSVAEELPASLLPEFGAWGASLLQYASTEIASYDAIVTKCIATGSEAASITSVIHSIASQPPGMLCEFTGSPSNGTASTTASTAAYPTAAANGTSISAPPTSTIPVAGAARPTGVLAGAAALGGLMGAVALL
ncbi:hypothetical protein F5Y12DRAFT_672731 [Xylaria sp. FL1777]|nr:hypothetical protein F5Y12DRAFT_672731 [Xylaria sp. FL1777]